MIPKSLLVGQLEKDFESWQLLTNDLLYKQAGHKTSVPGSMIEELEKEKRGSKGKRCIYCKSS